MTTRPSAAAPIVVVLAIVLVMLPAGYVLSIGPAYASDQISADTFHRAYGPVIDGAHAIGLSALLESYCALWAPLPAGGFSYDPSNCAASRLPIHL